ncbi:MAG: PAS domain-containing protein, partial [Desulfobacteraceae bacterium]
MQSKPTYKELNHRVNVLEQQIAATHEIDKAASRRWQDTFNAMSEALAIVDLDNRIVQCNRALCTLVGRSETEIIGRHCWDIIHG